MINLMKRVLAALVGLAIGAGLAVGLAIGAGLAHATFIWRDAFNRQEEAMKVEACVRGFKYAAAHYKVYNQVLVDQIKKDAAFECRSWKLQ